MISRATTLTANAICLVLVFLSTGASDAQELARSGQQHPPAEQTTKTVRLLTIGNSFTQNATRFLEELAAAGGHRLQHEALTIGGSSLQLHAEKAASFQNDPNDPKATYANGLSLQESLKSQPWDFVTIQQVSIKSHDLATYQPFAGQLARVIRDGAPQAKLLLHQTWAYRQDDPRFAKKPSAGDEPSTQHAMYRGLRDAYRRIAEQLGASRIPVGDAFFLADRDAVRGYKTDQSFLADDAIHPALPDQTHSLHVGWKWHRPDERWSLKMDGHHANVAGEYLGGCVWYETLFGESVLGNSFVPKGLDSEYATFLQKTAHRAVTAASEPSETVGLSVVSFTDDDPQRYQFQTRASELDPRTKEYPEIGFVFDKNGKPQDVQHASVDTRVAPQSKLVIWLMAPNEQLFKRLNDYGLHAIQVSYARQWFGVLCRPSPTDAQARGRVRLEAASGEDFSDELDLAGPDGLAERSRQFVSWLAKENPPGRWEQFLSDQGELRWEKVILAGSSHGSTTAARFAKHQKVARVVMLCGPRDQDQEWQSLPSATPPNRYFGFSHVLDGGWTGDHYCRSWEMLDLHRFGPIVNVDDLQPPYLHSRRLISAADVGGDAGRAHSSVTPGKASPRNPDGSFKYEPVWRYLFNHRVDQVGESEVADPTCLQDHVRY